jgi:hypothetical protein
LQEEAAVLAAAGRPKGGGVQKRGQGVCARGCVEVHGDLVGLQGECRRHYLQHSDIASAVGGSTSTGAHALPLLKGYEAPPGQGAYGDVAKYEAQQALKAQPHADANSDGRHIGLVRASTSE